MPGTEGNPQKKSLIIFKTFILALFIVIADQISKYSIRNFLSEGETLPILNNIFHLTLVHNTGVAFGLLKGKNLFFIFVTFAILLSIFVFFANGGLLLLISKTRSYFIGFSFIVGGAFGNLIDRICHGYVIDFLDFRIWPVFNIADSMISIGAVIIGVNYFITQKHEKSA